MQKIVITIIFAMISLLAFPAYAADKVVESPLFDLSGDLPEMSPELERREVEIPNIDALDIEVGIFGGMMNVEDFGAEYYYGVSGFFHVTEDFFINGNYGRSQIKDNTFRRLNLPLFGESGKRDISDLNVLVGWNFLSGELFWNEHHAFTSDVYLLAGAGSVAFDEENYFSLMAGIGTKILFTDWLALRFEAKFSEYDSSFLGYEKKSHNVDVITGISVFY